MRYTRRRYRNREELSRLIAVGLKVRGEAFRKTKTYKNLNISLVWMETRKVNP